MYRDETTLPALWQDSAKRLAESKRPYVSSETTVCIGWFDRMFWTKRIYISEKIYLQIQKYMIFWHISIS